MNELNNPHAIPGIVKNLEASSGVLPATALETTVLDAPERRAERSEDLRRLATGAGTALGGITLGRALRLVTDILLAHLLGPASFGLYAIGWTITRMATYLTPLGLDSGVIRFGSESWPENPARLKGVVHRSVEYSLASGLLFGAAFYLLAPWLGERMFHEPMFTTVFRWYAFAFPLMTVLRVASAATRISQRMKFSAYAEEICQPGTALLLILAFVGWKLNGALVAIVLSFGISLALAVYYVTRLFPEVGLAPAKVRFPAGKLFRFSLPTALCTVLGMIMIWVDRLMVGYFRPPGEAGMYYAASQISIALAAILAGFGVILSPMFAALYHRGRKERLEELFRVSTKWSLYLSLPPFLVMCLVPRHVMAGLFGSSYVLGAAVLPVLGLGQLFNSGTGAASALLVMTGNQNRIAVLTGGAVAVNVTLAVLLIPRWGISGAAWGTAVAVAGLSLLSLLVARALLGVWPYDRRYWKGMVAALVAGGAVSLVRMLVGFTSVVMLFAAAVVAMGVFTAMLLILKLDAEDREFIGSVLERIKLASRG